MAGTLTRLPAFKAILLKHLVQFIKVNVPVKLAGRNFFWISGMMASSLLWIVFMISSLVSRHER